MVKNLILSYNWQWDHTKLHTDWRVWLTSPPLKQHNALLVIRNGQMVRLMTLAFSQLFWQSWRRWRRRQSNSWTFNRRGRSNSWRGLRNNNRRADSCRQIITFIRRVRQHLILQRYHKQENWSTKNCQHPPQALRGTCYCCYPLALVHF